MNLTPDQEKELKEIMKLHQQWNTIPGLITWLVVMTGAISGLTALICVLFMLESGR